MSAGLFRPEEFRDNCGFGLIAHTSGDASQRLLQTAIESLTCMTHRGGIAADGKTGDGCGLLLQMPDQFMRTLAQECFGVALSDYYGIGQIFLSTDEQRAAAARRSRSSRACWRRRRRLGPRRASSARPWRRTRPVAVDRTVRYRTVRHCTGPGALIRPRALRAALATCLTAAPGQPRDLVRRRRTCVARWCAS